MRHLAAIALATGLALTGCGASQPGEASGDSSQTISSAAPADLSDGLITCTMPGFDGKSGLTTTERFVLIGGSVKRYSQFNNQAFDLCEAGQDKCALGIVNGVVRMDWTSQGGTRSRYDVDLGTLDIAAYRTDPGGTERSVGFAPGSKCVREPLPDGLEVL